MLNQLTTLTRRSMQIILTALTTLNTPTLVSHYPHPPHRHHRHHRPRSSFSLKRFALKRVLIASATPAAIDSGLLGLGALIRDSSTLEVLQLQSCGIESRHLIRLISALQSSRPAEALPGPPTPVIRLKELDLSGNKIGESRGIRTHPPGRIYPRALWRDAQSPARSGGREFHSRSRRRSRPLWLTWVPLPFATSLAPALAGAGSTPVRDVARARFG